MVRKPRLGLTEKAFTRVPRLCRLLFVSFCAVLWPTCLRLLSSLLKFAAQRADYRGNSVTGVRAMLIWIASYPRSGNRFFRWVARFRYGMPERAKLAGPPESDPNFALLRSLENVIASPEPVMVKTHEFPDADAFPAVYVLRDGRDAMVSYTHFALTVVKQVSPDAITPTLFHTTMRSLKSVRLTVRGLKTCRRGRRSPASRWCVTKTWFSTLAAWLTAHSPQSGAQRGAFRRACRCSIP